MNRKLKIFLVSVVAIAFLSAVCFTAYYIGRSASEEAINEMIGEMNAALANEHEAAVVKRVSKQMEDIAYQQKSISDIQRQRAEEQSVLALQNAQKAEEKSRIAKEAESKALQSADEAERERKNAEQQQLIAEVQRDEATKAKNIADTLNFRTQGKIVGTISQVQRQSGNTELGDLLAYTSWYFLNKYKGNDYFAECFKAISMAVDSEKQLKLQHNGAVNAIAAVPGNKDQCVAVSDYGEVELITNNGKSLTSKVLLQDPSFNFRDVYATANAVYALSHKGVLCKIDYNGANKQIVLPEDSYLKVLTLGDGNLLMVGKRTISYFNTSTDGLSAPQKLPSELSTAGLRGNDVYLFFENGKVAVMDKVGTIVPREPFVKEVITSVCFDKTNNCFYLGSKTGMIYPFNRNDIPLTLDMAAQKSKIAAVTNVGSVMVTAGYDKSIYIWQMANLLYPSGKDFQYELQLKTRENTEAKSSVEWVVPVAYSYDGWTLSLERSNDGESIWIGTSTGNVIHLGVLVQKMAERTLQKINRNMTIEEWYRYVSTSIPYITFK